MDQSAATTAAANDDVIRPVQQQQSRSKIPVKSPVTARKFTAASTSTTSHGASTSTSTSPWKSSRSNSVNTEEPEMVIVLDDSFTVTRVQASDNVEISTAGDNLVKSAPTVDKTIACC